MKEYIGKTSDKKEDVMWESEMGRYWADWAGGNGYVSGGVSVGGGMFIGAGVGLILWSVLDISPWIIAGCTVAGLGLGLILMAVFVAASTHQVQKHSRKQ